MDALQPFTVNPAMSIVDFMLNFNVLMDGLAPQWDYPYIDEEPTIDFTFGNSNGSIISHAQDVTDVTSSYEVYFNEGANDIVLQPDTLPVLITRDQWQNVGYRARVALMHTFEVGSDVIVNPIVAVHLENGDERVAEWIYWGGAPTYRVWLYNVTKLAVLSDYTISDKAAVENAIRSWMLSNNLGFTRFLSAAQPGSDTESGMVLPLSYRLEV